MRGFVACVFILMGAGLAAMGQSRDENWNKCKADDPDTSIAGCAALIQSGAESTENQASAYYNRGIAQKFFSRGYVVKPGKRFHFCEGELYYLNEKGEEVTVAKGSSTMAIVDASKE